MEHLNYRLTITTMSGQNVSAPLLQWVQALILHRSNEDMLALLQFVQQAQSPVIALPLQQSRTIPADPQEFVLPDGRLRS